MVIVHVKHFLNEAGQKVFPDWLKAIAEALGKYPGFIAIQQLTNIAQPEECHLLLQFENIDLLRRWAASETHDEFIARLEPYQTQKQQSLIFEAGHSLP